MHESRRPARERIIKAEVRKLERRQALERSRQQLGGTDVPTRKAPPRTAGEDEPL